MQWLNRCYAQWFNWRHRHMGHAFFRRFHSVLIETDSQLVEVARYILLNPVRAHLCKKPRLALEQLSRDDREVADAGIPQLGLAPQGIRRRHGADSVNFAAFIRAAE
jgi:hypothetical protein